MKKYQNLLLLILSIAVILSFTAGTPGTEWETHKFHLKGKKYYIDLPSSPEQKTRVLAGSLAPPPQVKGDGDRFEFLFKDSILVFVHKGDRFRMPNEENYASIGWPGKADSYTIISGIQKDGTHWKEIYHNDVVSGYKNVPDAEKEVYEKALKSFRKTKKLK